MSIPLMPRRPRAINRRLVAGRGSVCHTPMLAIGDDGVTVSAAVEACLVHFVMDYR
jgi:hypothetical protein